MIRALIVVLGLGAIGTISVVAGVIGAYYYVQPGLPAAQTIRDIPLQIPLRIFSRDGYLMWRYLQDLKFCILAVKRNYH